VAKEGEIQYPSSPLVKYLNVLAVGLTIAGVVLDAALPILQQVGKNKQAKSGLEKAIGMTIFFTLIRTVPRLFSQTKKLRAQLQAGVE